MMAPNRRYELSTEFRTPSVLGENVSTADGYDEDFPV